MRAPLRHHRAVTLGALLLVLPLTLAGSIAHPAGAQEEPQEETLEVVRGALNDTKDTPERDDDQPVPGVAITVRTPAGEEIDTVESGDDGAWEVEVPDPGPYEVEIDTDTLPDDVRLRDEDRNVLTVTVRPAQSLTVVFALGEDTRQVASALEDVLQKVVLGINFGLIIAMMAIGLSLIFGTTGLVNFAHAEMVTFGALMTYLFNQTMGLQLIPAAILGMVAGGLAGGAFDLAVWRPLRRRKTGLIAMMVASIGLSMLFRYIFLYQFGGRTRPYGDYFAQRAVDIGPISMPPRDLWSIGISLVVLITVGLLLQLTRIGKATRAVADNPDLAASSGIDVDRVILVVWSTGGALAALGGVLLGLGEQVGWEMGFKQLLLVFAGVTLGGLGTAYGALVGSFIIGVAVQVSTVWVPSELNAVTGLAVLIGILLVRPQGILGQAERIG